MQSTPLPAHLRQALSGPRLALYQSFFKTGTDESTLGAYLWHEAVRASLVPLIGLIEVVLRNTVHHALSQQADRMASAAWYDPSHPRAIPLAGAARRQADELMSITDADGRRVVQTPDDFVANATFGFWVEVMRQLERGRRYRLAQAMFPGYAAQTQPADWKTSAPWDSIVGRVKQHKIFRDWIAHLHLLWTWKHRDATTGQLRQSGSPGAVMMALRQEMSRMVTTLDDVNPSFKTLWMGSFSQAHFFMLTTTRALFHFQHQLESQPQTAAMRDPRFVLTGDLWTARCVDNVRAFLKSPLPIHGP